MRKFLQKLILVLLGICLVIFCILVCGLVVYTYKRLVRLPNVEKFVKSKIPAYSKLNTQNKEIGKQKISSIKFEKKLQNTPKLQNKILGYNLEQMILTRVSKETGNHSIYFQDLRDGQIIKIGKMRRYAPASTFKVFTATLTLLSIQRGELSWSSGIKLSKGLVSPGPGTHFKESDMGKTFTVENLLYRMIVQSDNTAQSMLFALLGKTNIEERLKKDLGLENTSLLDFYTTNEDMASVLYRHYNYEILNEYNTNHLLDLMVNTVATDRIKAGLPKGTKAANKGGTLPASKNDVAIVFSDKADYILVHYTDGIIEEDAISTIKDVSKMFWDYVQMKAYPAQDTMDQNSVSEGSLDS